MLFLKDIPFRVFVGFLFVVSSSRRNWFSMCTNDWDQSRHKFL